MHLQALRVFCDVAQARSFSRGASSNGITQSAASQAVHQVEKHLAIRLIDRSTRPLTLTTAGRAFYEGCKAVLKRYDALEEQVRVLHGEVEGTVRVAAIYSVGLHHLPPLADQFRREHPKADLHIDCRHPDRVYEAVLADEADFGLVSYPRHDRHLVILESHDDEMVLVCPPEHALSGTGSLAPMMLNGQRFVAFDRDLAIRRATDRYLRARGASVRVTLEFDNTESIKQAVSRGAGLAILPEPTVRTEAERGILIVRPLDGDGFVRPLAIIHRRSKHLTRPAASFVALLLGRTDETTDLPASDLGASAIPADACPNQGDEAVCNSEETVKS